MGMFTATKYNKDLPNGVYNRMVAKAFEELQSKASSPFICVHNGVEIDTFGLMAISLVKNAYGEVFDQLGKLGGQKHLEAMLGVVTQTRVSAKKAFSAQPVKSEKASNKGDSDELGKAALAIRDIFTGTEVDVLKVIVWTCSFDTDMLARFIVESSLASIAYIMTNEKNNELSPMMLVNLAVAQIATRYSDLVWVTKRPLDRKALEVVKKVIKKQTLSELIASMFGEEKVDECISFLVDVEKKSLGVAFAEHIELFISKTESKEDDTGVKVVYNHGCLTVDAPEHCSSSQLQEIYKLYTTCAYYFGTEQSIADIYIMHKYTKGELKLYEEEIEELRKRNGASLDAHSVCALTSIRSLENCITVRMNNHMKLMTEQMEKQSSTLEKQKQINSEIKAELRQYRKDAEALKLDLKQKASKIAKLESRENFSVDPEQYKALQAEIDKLRDALSQSESAHRDTKRTLTKREKDISGYEATISSLSERVSELEKVNNSLKEYTDEMSLHKAYNQIPVESFVSALRDKKIVIIGGNMMHTKIQNYGLRGCKLFEANSKYVGFEEIANADLVVIASAFVDHSTVERPVSLAKQHGINLLRYDNKNADMLIYAMFSAIYN